MHSDRIKPAWTGKYGVRSAREFLDNHAAQAAAFEYFVNVLDRRLGRRRVTDANNQQVRAKDLIGLTVNGVREEFMITESGLAAAMHRQGSGAVSNYLEWLNRNEMNSRGNIERIQGERRKEIFRSIETRLREFSTVPLKKFGDEFQ